MAASPGTPWQAGFCRCSWRTSTTFGGLTLAGKLPVVPRPRGRLTAFPAPALRGAMQSPGSCPEAQRSDADTGVAGRTAPSTAHGSHPAGQGSRPQSLKSWPGGHLWGGVHILAPSWHGGGEGRRSSCQPPSDTQTRCVGDGALRVPPMTWLETRVSPRPVAPAPSAAVDAVHAVFMRDAPREGSGARGLH